MNEKKRCHDTITLSSERFFLFLCFKISESRQAFLCVGVVVSNNDESPCFFFVFIWV